MPDVSLRCPKCRNVCIFPGDRLFGFCNKCGSRLERDIRNAVTVYDPAQEPDEMVRAARERYDVCTAMTVPTRADHDIESLNYEIERMMDEFMALSEVLKDIATEVQDWPDERKHRVFELCFDFIDRIYLQFEHFLKEYSDFGMYDELKIVRDYYSNELQRLSMSFSSRQRKLREDYWAGREEEYESIQKALREAIEARSRLQFMDFGGKWTLDAEIERLQNLLDDMR